MTDMSLRATTGEAEPAGPPPYSAEAVGKVAARIQIEGVQLLALTFHCRDNSPLSQPQGESAPDELGIGVEWQLNDAGSELGCVITFAAQFESNAPYELVARFGLTYSVRDGTPLATHDMNQFAHWNAVFNAWPYWREIVGSMLSRTRLDAFLVPVLPVPRDTTHPRQGAQTVPPKNVRHVVPNPEGGWDVHRPHAKRSSGHFETQRDAEDRAKEIVRRSGGGEVRIHRPDGTIRDSDTIAPGNDPFPPRDSRH